MNKVTKATGLVSSIEEALRLLHRERAFTGDINIAEGLKLTPGRIISHKVGLEGMVQSRLQNSDRLVSGDTAGALLVLGLCCWPRCLCG